MERAKKLQLLKSERDRLHAAMVTFATNRQQSHREALAKHQKELTQGMLALAKKEDDSTEILGEPFTYESPRRPRAVFNEYPPYRRAAMRRPSQFSTID